jgi:anti-sigma B factor antagonist
VETALGVFASRDRAEQAVQELRQHNIPEEAIVFLTRSESEAKAVARRIATYAGGAIGGAIGFSVGAVTASILLPGVGTVFALGLYGATLLGLGGVDAGGTLGGSMGKDKTVDPTPDEKCSDDVKFFRDVLREGRSLIVVRTESPEVCATASGILDRLGIGIHQKTDMVNRTTLRYQDGIAIIDVSGRITLGEPVQALRETVLRAIDEGHTRLLLQLAEVHYLDSSGLGELVKTYTTIRNRGGQMRLVAISARVAELLRITSLSSVFQIESDEASAIANLGSPASSAVA